ncbi:Transcription factor [Penicillium cf. griseofulvum]|nr:Transcription factor [Penicillium cf. griseofulvum]
MLVWPLCYFFPAIAALHGIVLAALHVDGAVDMDVYGAFQLCSIGILTAPATVRLSKTYFNNPGRDIIFLWTVLLLVGLISLIVEFMRLEPIPCPSGDPASIYWASTGGPNGGEFKFDSNCGLPCTENGPISPLRRGAADNIYVIPVPSELTFNAATLIAAACCIPAILSLVSMWIKILDEKFLKGKYKQKPDELIEGTNGATVSHMTGITKVIKKWLTIVGLPLFAAAVLAILVKGEMNFWSFQMMHQTEPIQSIGQWAPVVGTALAVLGSLYLIFSADMDAVEIDGQQEEGTVEKCPHCDCAVSNTGSSSRRGSRTSAERQDTNTETTPIRRPTTNTQPDLGRRRVARFLSRTSALLADKAHKQIEEGGFKRNAKTTYPLTPGEEYKNSKLQDQIDHYQRSSTPDNRSRAASFISNAGSVDNGEGSSRPRSPTRHSVPARAVSRPISRNAHSNSLPSGGVLRASTLQCPPATVFGGWQGQSGPFASTSISRSRAPSTSEISPTASSPGRQSPPRIFVSHDEGS